MGMDGDIVLRKAKEHTRVALANFTPDPGALDAAITNNTAVASAISTASSASSTATVAQGVAASAQAAVASKVAKGDIFVNVRDYGATGDGTSDDSSAINAAILAVFNAGGGCVFFPSGRFVCEDLVLRDKVSLVGASQRGSVLALKPSSTKKGIVASVGYATAANSNNPNLAIGSFTIANLTFDGNRANQAAANAAPPDWKDARALVVLYGYNYTISDVEINNAPEIALLTDMAASWGTTVTNTQNPELQVHNLKIKTYGRVGWLHRGPHDSHIASVYISNSGTSPEYGYLQQSLAGAHDGGSTIVDHMHVWGSHSIAPVAIQNSSILRGTIFAEGTANGDGLLLDGAFDCDVKLIAMWSNNACRLTNNSKGNRVELAYNQNIKNSMFRVELATGNWLGIGKQLGMIPAGGWQAPAYVFDLAYPNSFADQNTYVADFWAWAEQTGQAYRIAVFNPSGSQPRTRDAVHVVKRSYSGELTTDIRTPVVNAAGVADRIRLTNGEFDHGGTYASRLRGAAFLDVPVVVKGTEKLTNYDFTGSATGWTLGGGWAYASDAVTHTAGTAGTITQSISGVTAGEWYEIVLDQTATAGTISLSLGTATTGQRPYWHTASALLQAAETGTVTVTLDVPSAYAGTISSVSVQKVSEFSTADRLATVRSELRSLPNGNVGFGEQALQTVTSGQSNTAIGRAAGQRVSAGQNNTAIGNQALQTATVAQQDTAVGSLALRLATSGQANTAIGYNSLSGLTSGSQNTGVGVSAGSSLTTQTGATAIGRNAQVTGDRGVAIGADASAAADAAVIKANTLELSRSTGTGATTLYLRSPNGSRWAVTVTDAGALAVASA